MDGAERSQVLVTHFCWAVPGLWLLNKTINDPGNFSSRFQVYWDDRWFLWILVGFLASFAVVNVSNMITEVGRLRDNSLDDT